MIEVSGLTKDYGLNRAVDGVSFRIEKGDIVGLLGPNGSGKTTIMRMLTGFFAPTAGSCRVAGIPLATDPVSARRKIGYLPERVALYPGMRVKHFLAFAAAVREVPRSSVGQHVEEVLELCGLTDVASQHIGKLSRGYNQRVGIAQAIIHRPEVLILDEPTVGLDPRQIVDIRALIGRLAGRATVLLSTHILPEVSAICNRVLILDRGRLVASDTVAGLSARTAGRGEVLVRLNGPEDEAVALAASIDGVRGTSVRPRSSGGVVELIVSTEPGCEVISKLAEAVVAKGWPLLELSPRTLSLEELFVEILEEGEEQ
ncbi:MAG: ATP-binding cassette domain-containing protein [Deltaproteobacteria bacterium]